MNFEKLTATIEQTHQHFQQQAVKAVNVSLTVRNWLFGYYISEFELNGSDRANYGDKLFDSLADRLKSIKGIDRRSLYRFKDFYTLYPQIADFFSSAHTKLNLPFSITEPIVGLLTPQFEAVQKVGLTTPQSQNKLQVPVDKLLNALSYTHIEQLLQIEDPVKRVFYEISCIKGTWSVKELKRQINTLAYERVGLSNSTEIAFDQLQQKIIPESANDAIKSVYLFDFMGLNSNELIEEKDLESALLNHLQEFMLELGNGFCFEHRQKRILIDDDYYLLLCRPRILSPNIKMSCDC